MKMFVAATWRSADDRFTVLGALSFSAPSVKPLIVPLSSADRTKLPSPVKSSCALLGGWSVRVMGVPAADGALVFFGHLPFLGTLTFLRTTITRPLRRLRTRRVTVVYCVTSFPLTRFLITHFLTTLHLPRFLTKTVFLVTTSWPPRLTTVSTRLRT